MVNLLLGFLLVDPVYVATTFGLKRSVQALAIASTF